MKNILIAGAVLIVALGALLLLVKPTEAPITQEQGVTVLDEKVGENSEEITPTAPENGRIANPDANTQPPAPVGKLKVGNFTGKLEEVNTGCFSDGECYVVVGGKHITTLMGWSQKVVGSVQGVEGFGDLESHIGANVEVYAQDNSDGTYTLYGSEGFYIKLLTKPVSSAQGACVIGGCSSQLCVDASQGDMVSTCEYREEYACYKTAACERQSSGRCGWTETPTLKSCLMNA
jgi:hypothetical protein